MPVNATFVTSQDQKKWNKLLHLRPHANICVQVCSTGRFDYEENKGEEPHWISAFVAQLIEKLEFLLRLEGNVAQTTITHLTTSPTRFIH